MRRTINLICYLLFASLLVSAFIACVQAEDRSKTAQKEEELAKQLSRVNNFLNTKFPHSYGAPIYHYDKARALQK